MFLLITMFLLVVVYWFLLHHSRASPAAVVTTIYCPWYKSSHSRSVCLCVCTWRKPAHTGCNSSHLYNVQIIPHNKPLKICWLSKSCFLDLIFAYLISNWFCKYINVVVFTTTTFLLCAVILSIVEKSSNTFLVYLILDQAFIEVTLEIEITMWMCDTIIHVSVLLLLTLPALVKTMLPTSSKKATFAWQLTRCIVYTSCEYYLNNSYITCQICNRVHHTRKQL